MAGVTDRPFRSLCKKMGAGMAVSEMVASNSLLWGSEKTIRRGNHEGEVEPKVIQIAGADPEMMAEAAKYNVDNGADIIDINMGCPAKKICNVCCRVGAAAERAAGGEDRRCGGEGGQCSGHAQDPHGLEQGKPQRAARGEDRRGARHPVARDARPHARLHVHGRCGVRHDPRREAVRLDSRGRQRRHHHAREGEVRARVHGRRRRDDRPRRPGPPLDLPRDRPLPRDGEPLAAAGRDGDPRRPGGPPGRPLWLLRHGARLARGTQAHQLVHEGPQELGRVPCPHEHPRERPDCSSPP